MDSTGAHRRLLGAVVALIVLVAIGAPAVLLTAGSAEAQDTTTPTDTTPQATTPEAPPPEAPAPAPEWNPTTTYEQPAEQLAEQPAPSEEPQQTQEPSQPSQPSSGVGAQNQSTVIQAIVQVQVGCHTYCHGTSQHQSATQGSNTTQDATAVAPQDGSSSATATNQSTTIQYVWQTQVGCVAFCWDTDMSQSATQDAATTQTATAVSDSVAQATNVGETLQHVWQVQQGCQVECHGVTASQTVSQHSTTSQSATATAPGEGGSLPDWLVAFAESIGATIQTIYQYEEASCLDHCGEEALAQEATQLAETHQTSTAGDVPKPTPPDPAEPPASTPPAAAGSGGPPTATVAAAGRAAAIVDSGRSHHRHHRELRATRREPRSPLTGPWGGTPQSAGGAGTSVPASDRHSARRATARASASSSPAATVAPAPASFEPPASPPRDGSRFPWLPAGLLLVAAVCALLGLREGDANHLRTSEDRV
jgi:outer membrane biosynthesis protein TonB